MRIKGNFRFSNKRSFMDFGVIVIAISRNVKNTLQHRLVLIAQKLVLIAHFAGNARHH